MKRGISLAFVALIAAKLWVAAGLGLFGDEAFYWQCSQRLALAYADHPPLTALLVRLGSEALGDTALGIRVLFLVCGAALPVAIFYLARPLVGDRDAWWTTGASLAIPAVAHLGLLAIPDVPMLLLAALFLLAFEGATRFESARFGSARFGSASRGLRWWLLAGLVGGLGLVTHYRFALVVVAAVLYLVLTRRGRKQWRHAGVWWMFAGWTVGLVPAVVYNLRHAFTPLRYYLEGRHGSSPQLDNLLEHVAGQALLVTPLLYVFLIVALVRITCLALAGDDRAALLATFAWTHLGLFFLASPFEDSRIATVHWPAPGYLALLPSLPMTLRGFGERGASWRRFTVLATPALGALVMVLVLIELGTGWLRLAGVREPFVGYAEASARSLQYLSQLRLSAEGRSIIVADNYKLGANLELALHETADIFVLDHHKNRQHGRAPQLVTWGIDEQGLRRQTAQERQAAREALIVIEVTQIRTGTHDAWVAHASSFFTSFEQLGELRVPSFGKRKKEKIFWFYRGTLR